MFLMHFCFPQIRLALRGLVRRWRSRIERAPARQEADNTGITRRANRLYGSYHFFDREDAEKKRRRRFARRHRELRGGNRALTALPGLLWFGVPPPFRSQARAAEEMPHGLALEYVLFSLPLRLACLLAACIIPHISDPPARRGLFRCSIMQLPLMAAQMKGLLLEVRIKSASEVLRRRVGCQILQAEGR